MHNASQFEIVGAQLDADAAAWRPRELSSAMAEGYRRPVGGRLSEARFVPISINDKGQVTGYYETSTAEYGFVYSNGQYTSIDPPGSSSTLASSINNSGQVVGFYEDNTTNHGFVATDPPSPTTAPHQDLAAATSQLVQAMASFSPMGSTLNAGPFNQMNDAVMQLSNHLARPH